MLYRSLNSSYWNPQIWPYSTGITCSIVLEKCLQMLMLLRRKRSDSICCLFRRRFIRESLLKPQPDDRWPQAGPGWALHCVCASVCVLLVGFKQYMRLMMMTFILINPWLGGYDAAWLITLPVIMTIIPKIRSWLLLLSLEAKYKYACLFFFFFIRTKDSKKILKS